MNVPSELNGGTHGVVVRGPAKTLEMKLLILGRELKLPTPLFNSRRTTDHRLSLATSGEYL